MSASVRTSEAATNYPRDREVGVASSEGSASGASPLATLGLDLTLFSLQLVNFVIVLLIVWFLILRPLTRKLDERKRIIDKSLEQAQEIKTRLGMADRLVQEKHAEARHLTDQIVAQAHEEARIVGEKMRAQVKQEIVGLVKKAKEQVAEDRQKTIKELRAEASRLAISVAERILLEKIDTEKDGAIIARAVSSLTK